MVRGLCGLVVIMASCGRVGFDRTGSDGDAIDSDGSLPPVTSRSWVKQNDGRPGGLHGPRMAWDGARQEIVLYGGGLGSMVFPYNPIAVMWRYAPSGWTQICDPCAPGRRWGSAFAYDPVRQVIVMTGGIDENSTILSDHWEWDGTSWAQRTTSAPARWGSAMAFDANRGRMVLIGGGTLIATMPFDPNADDTVWELVGASWTQIPAGGGPNAVVNAATAAAYDPASRRIVVFSDPATQPARDDLFAWDGSTWSPVCTDCTGRLRSWAGLIYDPANASLFVVGGYDHETSLEIGGTWRSAPGTWPMVSADPPLRDSMGLAFDPIRNVIVMYGGNGLDCSGAASSCDETWWMVPD